MDAQPTAATTERQPDSDYVKQTVGPAVTAGLTKLAKLQPSDPIEYLSQFLINQHQRKKASAPAPATAST